MRGVRTWISHGESQLLPALRSLPDCDRGGRAPRLAPGSPTGEWTRGPRRFPRRRSPSGVGSEVRFRGAHLRGAHLRDAHLRDAYRGPG
ncbi:MAG: pentapeptide repeat-containing protein [Myxococcota bacterium]